MMNIPGLLSDEEKQSINNGAMLNAALALIGNRSGRGLAGAANAAAGGLGAYGQAQQQGLRGVLQGKQLQQQMEEAQQKRLMQQRLGEMFASTTDAPESKFNAYMQAANLAAAQGNSEAAKRYAEIAQQFKPKEDEGYSLSPGQARFKGGVQVASMPAAPEKPEPTPNSVREYQFAQQQGFKGTYQEFEMAMRRAGASQVRVDTGANKFSEQANKITADTYNELRTQGNNAARSSIQLDRLEGLLQQTGSGLLPQAKAIAGNFGINTKGLSEIQAVEAIVNQLVPNQRPAGSGTMSDRDVALFKSSLPRLINQPDGNRQIIGTTRAIAQYDTQVGRIAADALAGRITPEEADKRIAAVQNPLANFAPSKLVYNPKTGRLEEQ